MREERGGGWGRVELGGLLGLAPIGGRRVRVGGTSEGCGGGRLGKALCVRGLYVKGLTMPITLNIHCHHRVAQTHRNE